MQWLPWSSPIGRALFGLAVFTFAFWALAIAVFLTWSPGRSLAAAAAERVLAPRVPASDALASGDCDLAADTALCDDEHGFAYDTGTDRDDFSWAVVDDDGSVDIEGGNAPHVRSHAPSDKPTFWFRDDSGEYWVDDRDIVDEVRHATAPLREIGREMGRVGAEMGRHGAAMGRIGGRMGAIGGPVRCRRRAATAPATRSASCAPRCGRSRSSWTASAPITPARSASCRAACRSCLRGTRTSCATSGPGCATSPGARAARERRGDRTRTREAHWGARLYRRSALQRAPGGGLSHRPARFPRRAS